MEFLNKRCVDVVPSGKEILGTFTHKTVLSVLEGMVQTRTTCIPVIDPENQFAAIGSVDVFDILCVVLDMCFPENKTPTETSPQKFSRDLLSTITAKQAMNVSGTGKWECVFSDVTFRQVLEKFCEPGIREVPIVSRKLHQFKGDNTSFIMKQDIINFFATHLHLLENFCDKTIVQARISKSVPLFIHESRPAFDAFRLIINYNISGVAVTDSDGKFLGAITCNDISLALRKNFFRVIFKSARDFMEDVQRKCQHWVPPPHVWTCGHFDTFQSVICKMNCFRLPCIWILGSDGIPAGILTQRDIIKWILKMERKVKIICKDKEIEKEKLKKEKEKKKHIEKKELECQMKKLAHLLEEILSEEFQENNDDNNFDTDDYSNNKHSPEREVQLEEI